MNLEIPIEDQTALFKKHFEEAGNERIIFSGAFGTGKSYFLERYFHPSQSDYLAIKLAPVNYSISSNEDIFKLIKYDILFELAVLHNVALKTEEVSWDIAIGTVLPSKVDSIIQPFLPLIPLLNKAEDAIPVALAAFASWVTTKQEIAKAKKATGQETEVLSFAEEITAKYQLEADYITGFLEQALTNAKEAKQAKYKVLIIDDLDRIDPEHIFRLFNIFSAHFDYHKSSSNKFGFDRVIFVCDIQNIRNIFHSRYGTDTDFTGYIDKFFSKEIYFYSNEAEIAKYVGTFIQSFNIDDKDAPYYQKRILQARSQSERGLLFLIINELLVSGALKMRRIKEMNGSTLTISRRELDISNPRRGQQTLEFKQVPALVTIEILVRIMGGAVSLSKAIKLIQRFDRTHEFQSAANRYSGWMAGMLLPLLDMDNHKFQTSDYQSNESYYYSMSSEFSITYSLVFDTSGTGMYFGKTPFDSLERVDFFHLLDMTIDLLLKKGIIK